MIVMGFVRGENGQEKEKIIDVLVLVCALYLVHPWFILWMLVVAITFPLMSLQLVQSPLSSSDN